MTTPLTDAQLADAEAWADEIAGRHPQSAETIRSLLAEVQRLRQAEGEGHEVMQKMARMTAEDIDELLALRAEALRFYRADGSYETLASPGEVIERRKAAAEEIERLKAAVTRLTRERAACDGSCDIALARRQIGPDGVVPGNAKECAEMWEREAHRLEMERRALATEAERLKASAESARRVVEEAADDLTTWLEQDVNAFGPSSLRPHPCAPGFVRDRLRAFLAGERGEVGRD